MTRTSSTIAACLLVAGCRTPATPPSDLAQQVAAFRTEYEASLVAPTGPRTAVDAHYVDPGHRLRLQARGGTVQVVADAAPAGEAEVAVRVDADGTMRCERGCGPGPVPIDAMTHTPLGEHTILLSPQSGTLRVLVHAPAPTPGHDVAWFAVDPKWWLEGRLAATPDAPPQMLATTRGLVKALQPAGRVTFTVPGGAEVTLTAYVAEPGRLMIPFTDPSNGVSSYAVGRYLYADDGGARVVLDFNRATNPWCAYSAHYNCPVPPVDNAILVAVEAGERSPH
jgi:hypothetical protein